MKPERPAGVTAVATAFLLTAAYLLTVGLTMLVRPGSISMAAGSELLGGLELAGPYMFLLMSAVGVTVALGLLRLHGWARWMAILIAMIGMVLQLPTVSSAVIDFRAGKLVWGGLGTILRAMVVWYLFRPDVREAFTRN
jgi:hypothetical protein